MSGSERLNKLSSITLANVPTIMVDKEQQFHDHVNKCRCCFNEFVADNRKVEISEWHRKVFRSVIKVELRMDSNLSAYLCQNCDKKLKNTSEFVQVIEKMTDRCDQDEYTLKDNNISHDIIEDNENVLGVMGNIEIDKEQFSTHQIKFKLAFYCEIDMGLISKVNLKDCSVNLERLSENSSRKYMTEFELLFKKDSKIEKLLLYCDQCRYQTTRRQYIYNHIKRMHKQIEIFFNCDLCRYQTTIKPYIHNHMKRTHSFKESKCMKCDKVYANETKLRDNVVRRIGWKDFKRTLYTMYSANFKISLFFFLFSLSFRWKNTEKFLKRLENYLCCLRLQELYLFATFVTIGLIKKPPLNDTSPQSTRKIKSHATFAKTNMLTRHF